MAFDRAHDISEPAVPDAKEVLEARKSAIAAQARYDQTMSDCSVSQATVAKATAAAADAAARVSALSGKPFPPNASAGAPADAPPAPAPAAR